MISFDIKITDVVLEVHAFNESTKRYCEAFFTDEKPDYTITMTEEDLKNESSNSENGQVYVNEEISALYRKIADLLVEDDIIVFHSSAISVDDNGFLITAHSGVGKSTHARLLSEYLGDSFKYINDDKPMLKVSDDGVTIFSTPWNGKERRGNNINAPLKAIIFLNRGETNTYRKIDNKEEIYIRMLSQIYLPKEKSKRDKALNIADKLLKLVSFYEINVNMDIDAAKMTYEGIMKNEIK